MGALLQEMCNRRVKLFLEICCQINFPVAWDKTCWASQIIIFLGMLLNTMTQTISIPIDKRKWAMRLLSKLYHSKKTTVYKVQQITGILAHMSRGIVPGQAFTKRMYVNLELC